MVDVMKHARRKRQIENLPPQRQTAPIKPRYFAAPEIATRRWQGRLRNIDAGYRASLKLPEIGTELPTRRQNQNVLHLQADLRANCRGVLDFVFGKKLRRLADTLMLSAWSARYSWAILSNSAVPR